ncbi:MAG: amidohydrolase family protein [Gemmatimonadota bacterium]
MSVAILRQGDYLIASIQADLSDVEVVELRHELAELVGVGLSELEAMRAATTTAAELLGLGERVGRLASGYDADLLVLDRDPLADIGAYHDVLLVMSDGRVIVDRLDF